MPVRGLSAEQLFDSLAIATGYQEGSPGGMYFKGFGASVRSEFLTKFANSSDRPIEMQTSILQALALMNGSLTRDATNLQKSELLAAVTDAPFMDPAAKLETLYLAALSRKPTPKEISRLARYIEEGGVSTAKEPDKRQNEALADIFWAILNSSEFRFNH
jgi:hypothetical protein